MKDGTFTADRLLALYNRVAEAEDAIPRLRRFVLDLAVRGKLVEQDPANEPAAQLLKRIAKEKARLVKAGGFKKFEGILDRDATSFPFALPPNWQWTYLDDLAAIARGGSPRPIKSFLTDDQSGIPWIKIGDSTRGSIYIDETQERIIPEGVSRSRLVSKGDLLLSNSMSFGYPYITRIDGCIHDGWLVIRPPEHIEKLYLHKVFLSDFAKSIFSGFAAGAVVQNLNAEKVRLLPVPLPPLAEQQRIVAKVDELMELCDQFQAARAGREAVRDRLTAATWDCLTAPATDAETFPTHARFALQTLPTITTRPDQIKRLRQTILNLAVRGKLVEQDPANEPAAELLKRIAKEKARLGIRRPSEGYDATDLPFDLPHGWSNSSVGEICSKTGSGSTPRGGKEVYSATGIPFLRSQNVYDDGLRLDDVAYIGPDVHQRMSGTVVKAADLLLNITGGSMGRCCRIPDNFNKANVSQHVAIVRPALPGMSDFLHRLVLSPYFQAFIFGEQTGAGRGGLPKNRMDRIAIALPPLAEQHRIVAKVDALMALCDQLEASLTTATTTRSRLLEALLHEALGSTLASEAA